jgi:hypothetical protein
VESLVNALILQILYLFMGLAKEKRGVRHWRMPLYSDHKTLVASSGILETPLMGSDGFSKCISEL